MKILVTTRNFAAYIVPNFHEFLTEVAKSADLTVWHESGDINEILNQLDSRPDFIFINEFGETNSPQISGLGSLTIPYAVLLYDLHYNVEERRKVLNEIRPLLPMAR